MNLVRKQQKIRVFVNFLSEIASLSTSQTLKVGAMALKKDFSKIGSFGYNGSYSNAIINPYTNGEEKSLQPGQSGFVHAEMNLVAKFHEHNPEDYIILLTHSPCDICIKILLNSGFRCMYWGQEYRMTDHLSILNELNIYHGSFNDLHVDYPIILGEYLEKVNQKYSGTRNRVF